MQFTLFRFPIRIDNSAWLMAGVYLLFGLQAQQPLLASFILIATIFGSVLIHELGHAFAARHYRLEPIEITLEAFGGLTSRGGGGSPGQDLKITLAGPAAGLTLGLVAGALAWFIPTGEVESLLIRLFTINLFWTAYNLAPLFPLDGGAALLAVLRMVAPRHAWNVTTAIGLFGGITLAILATVLMVTKNGGMFFLFMAGSIIHHNWGVRQLLKAEHARIRR